MHNGQIGGYAQLRRKLEAMLGDELFYNPPTACLASIPLLR